MVQAKRRKTTLTYIVRTSDRIKFKSCREDWNFSSKLRRNLEPKRLPQPLEFGSAIHSGLQVRYDPRTWHWPTEVVEAAALQAFVDTNRQALLRYEGLTGSSNEEIRAEFEERHRLGVGMLKNYFEWFRSRDKFTPMFVEVEFEVPIPARSTKARHALGGLSSFRCNVDGNLEKFNYMKEQWEPVVYQGRIDLVVQDERGEYFIDDHKTAGQMREDVITHLEMDEQMKSYAWAIQKQLNIPVAGIIYNELYKGIPEPPKMNKSQRLGRWYSVAQNIDTSYDLYLETVREGDPGAYEAGLYDDMLNMLKQSPNKFFRRTVVRYSDIELENLGSQICLEAIDMLNDPLIYPNPSRFKCGYCMFRTPCLAQMDGSDVDFILKEMYIQRSQTTNGSQPQQHPQDVEV